MRSVCDSSWRYSNGLGITQPRRIRGFVVRRRPDASRYRLLAASARVYQFRDERDDGLCREPDRAPVWKPVLEPERSEAREATRSAAACIAKATGESIIRPSKVNRSHLCAIGQSAVAARILGFLWPFSKAARRETRAVHHLKII
jgi:hypothetical protein